MLFLGTINSSNHNHQMQQSHQILPNNQIKILFCSVPSFFVFSLFFAELSPVYCSRVHIRFIRKDGKYRSILPSCSGSIFEKWASLIPSDFPPPSSQKKTGSRDPESHDFSGEIRKKREKIRKNTENLEKYPKNSKKSEKILKIRKNTLKNLKNTPEN